MLAPPKRVGFYPNGAFLRCPHVLFLPHFSAYIVSVCTAGRSGLNLSCTKIERPALSLPWAFTEAKSGIVREKCAGRLGTLAQPSALQLPTKGPTPRFSSRRCTDATRPAGGPHKPSQGLTRGSTFLGCRVQLRWAVIGGGCPEEHLLSTLRFSELFQSVLIFWGISLP